MSTYRMIEVVGVSKKSYEDAIKSGIEDTKESFEDSNQNFGEIEWFQILDQRGKIENGKVSEFQVRFNVSFTVKKC